MMLRTVSATWRGRPPIACLSLSRNFHSTFPSTSSNAATCTATTANEDDKNIIMRLPHCNVYRFGEAPPRPPLFKDLDWTIKDGEAWAVVGTASSGKNELLETLLGHYRIVPPPPGGIWPFLRFLPPDQQDPHNVITSVSFTARPKSLGTGFYDYSARYGAMRDEDKLTVRESLMQEAKRAGVTMTEGELDEMAEMLHVTGYLDLPLIAMSNGQTRRANILRKLLTRPKVLLLDEPLTGLDVQHRAHLSHVLGNLHSARSPRIILALRPQDPIPPWTTHIALVRGPEVVTGPEDQFREELARHAKHHAASAGRKGPTDEEVRAMRKEGGQVLVDMKDVNVAYKDRHVLKNINWTIRQGEHWHLQGPNGSGKTTLLSLLTGDHPQSFVQKHLQLFGRHRRQHATLMLQQQIGFVSPELFNAFPRRLGSGALSARDAIGTGFECTFSYRVRTADQEKTIDSLLEALAPEWTANFLKQPFATLKPGEQSLVLLMRAIVNKPRLLILDEVFAGMDDEMVGRARRFLKAMVQEANDKADRGEGEGMAVVWVSHWEEEMPWAWEQGEVRRIKLQEGEAIVS